MSPLQFSRFALYVPSEAFLHVVNDPRFQKAPGSSDKHHNWTGGLAKHTEEVIQISLDMAKSVFVGVPTIDFEVLVTAGLWHDFGKIWAYEQIEASPGGTLQDGTVVNASHKWVDTPLKSLTGGHLARSYAEWISFCKTFEALELRPRLQENFINAVGHCILAHHGCREWGSPCSPQTPEAYILHLADSCSARLLGGESLGHYNKRK